MPGYLDLNPISLLDKEKQRILAFIDTLKNRDGINPEASQEKIDGLISQLNLKMREYDLAILRLNTKVRIEMYSENLDKYIGLVHDAVEGRYELTGYDLSVIESALVQLQGEEIPNDKRLEAINGGLAEVFLRLAKHLPVDVIAQFDELRAVIMKDIAKLITPEKNEQDDADQIDNVDADIIPPLRIPLFVRLAPYLPLKLNKELDEFRHLLSRLNLNDPSIHQDIAKLITSQKNEQDDTDTNSEKKE